MADIYMHTRLCEDVLKGIKNDVITDTAYLGAQGPDPMYYNMFNENNKLCKDYADGMHRNNTQGLLINMVDYVKNNYNKETYSFLVGFIAHYSLDVKIHPFVYHNVGVYNKANANTHHMRGLHLKFERAMDALFIEKETKKPSRKFRMTKKYYTLKHTSDEVNNLMADTFKYFHNEDNGAELYRISAKAMFNTVRFIDTDRFGIKKQIYKLVDMFNKDIDMYYKDLSYFNHLEKYDYHNDQKKEWLHPLTGEVYNYTVMELYDQARIFALEMVTKVDEYLSGNTAIDLTKVFTNLSFNSGVECDLGMDFKYLNIYRK